MSRKKKIDTRHLFHGICHLNVIPVLRKTEDDQGMISQMLFGETCIILEKKNKHWFKIQTTECNITGWVRSIQITLISENDYSLYQTKTATALEICHPVFNDEYSKSIVMGSTLPLFDGISCTMPDNKYVYNGQAAQSGGLELNPEILVKIARRYLFSPELQGGRSPFGIDGGALIQNVFRFFEISLPRFPHEQYMYGEIIDFVELAQEGDLAFCQDENGQITHAGIVIGDKKILHCYGCVRIDKLDHFGFYNAELRKYTHKLRIIKRVI
ncbi:MAG: C40 family peptidase [Saprospiraceae bacterium]|nr:C40 family peptidase [Saprospiraceae bacterium]MBK8670482.1 C40 family peptidase [Saprospiraceae bacterium]MBL0100291.1 C40 family peptidase [Saprospiraceae bacterium]